MTTVAAPEIGRRYRLLDRLGAGGMGEVFRALDRLTRQNVALKRVTGKIARIVSGSGGLRRVTELTPIRADIELWGDDLNRELKLKRALAREFRTLSTLRHPNIISVLDYGFDDEGLPFYTMKLIDNPTDLREAARGRPLQRTIILLTQLLRALSYMHRRGIVHRDLKPANILVDDAVKVLDFGLAAPRDGLDALKAGTPLYMAPEVARGGPSTDAADIFAVGAIAYELLTGELPFTREQLFGATPVADLSKISGSDELRGVVGRLLAVDPRRRWSHADEVIQALGAACGLRLSSETRATRASFLEAAEFVGRTSELATLDDALSSTMGGAGGVWLIEGPSGIGKSRLIDELRAEALVRGATVVQSQAAAHRSNLQVWRDPIRRLVLAAPPDDATASILESLSLDLGALLERPIRPAELDPQTARDDVLGAIETLFELQERPVLIVLEDLHHARGSVDVLAMLAASLHALPVMVVGTYRGEAALGLAGDVPGAQTIRLAPLARREIGRLAQSMLGEDRCDGEIVGFLEKHSEGNVFFIVETVRALAEQAGGLSGIAASALPDRIAARGVETLVRERLDRIPDEHRGLIDHAAVIGRELDRAVLDAIHGETVAGDALRTCADLAILEVRDDTWRFTHDTFRETLLGALDERARAPLHGAVGSAIERVHGTSPKRAAILAYHFGAAGNLDKECRYSTLAGREALGSGAYAEAATHLNRSLELQSRLVHHDADLELDVLLALGSLRIATHGWSAPEVKALYDRAVEVGAQVGRETQVVPAFIGLSKFLMMSGRLREAREIAGRCETMGRMVDDPVIVQHGRLVVGNIALWLGEFAAHRDLFDEIDALYDPTQRHDHLTHYGQNPRLTSLVPATIGNWMLGEVTRARELAARSLEIADEDGNPFSLAIALQSCAWLDHLQGNVPETLEGAGRLRTLAVEHGFPPFEILALNLEGWALARLGDADSGIEQIRAATRRWPEIGAHLVSSFYSTLLADACLAAGQLDSGSDAVRQALDGSLGTEERCYVAELHRLEGELRLAAGDVAGARDEIVCALDVAAEQQARSFELRAATSLLGVHRRDGRGAGRGRLARLIELLAPHGETNDLRAARTALATLDG